MKSRDAENIDLHSYSDSIVHRLDPRAKVLSTLVFVVTVVSFGKYATTELIPFILFPMTLAIIGYVSPNLMLRQLAIALPFLFFIGLFNPIFDKSQVIIFGEFEISEGWISFASIIFRGLLCVSAAIVLSATTTFSRIAEALRALGVPKALVVQLLLLYRYLFVLIDESKRLLQAKQLRSPSGKNSLKIAVSMLSVLLVRTIDRAENIWLAMKARGFEGELKSATPMKWRSADTIFLAAAIFYCISMRVFPIAKIIGKSMVGI